VPNGRSVSLRAGQQAQVPLDEDGSSNGVPQVVVYEAEEFETLPIDILDEPIELPEPVINTTGQYAGTWFVSTSQTLQCAGGVTSTANAVTLNLTSQGTSLFINAVPLSQQSDSVFTFQDTASSVRLEFTSNTTGIVRSTVTSSSSACNGLTFVQTMSR
jgi:hypothetical protein